MNSEKPLFGFDVGLPSLRREVAMFLLEDLNDLADPESGEKTSEGQH